MTGTDDQQFCLRWNNFQSYITSQFETLRDDEDFVDVTLACEGQRLGAHKVVLSACSPFFKELFKSNPCRHPIVFMRDVEVRHVVALLEFMYAGEVNVAQTNLAGFLRTAESLQIRGLTDASKNKKTSDDKAHTETQPTSSQIPSSPTPETRTTQKVIQTSSTTLKTRVSPSRTVTSSQEKSPASPIEPPRKKHCKTDPIDSVEASLIGTSSLKTDIDTSDTNSELTKSELAQINPYAIETKKGLHSELDISTDLIEPKLELPDYSEDDEQDTRNFMDTDQQNAFANLAGGMQIIPGTSGMGDMSHESDQAWDNRKLHSLDPRPCPVCDRVYSNLSNLRQHMRLIHNPTHVECPSCSKSFKTTLYLKRHLVGCRGVNETGKLNMVTHFKESTRTDKMIATRSMSKRDEPNLYLTDKFNTSPAKCKQAEDDLFNLELQVNNSNVSHLVTRNQKNEFFRTGEFFNSETTCFENSDKYNTSYNSDDAIDNITV